MLSLERTDVRDMIFKYDRVRFLWSNDDKLRCQAVFFNEGNNEDTETVECKVKVGDRNIDTRNVQVEAYLEYPCKGFWHMVDEMTVWDPDGEIKEPCTE